MRDVYRRRSWVALSVKLQRVLDRAFQIERAEDQPAFNQVGLSGDWALGARVLAFGPAFSVGVDNGHEPGRTCDPHRSRHYETALSSSESDDVACQGA